MLVLRSWSSLAIPAARSLRHLMGGMLGAVLLLASPWLGAQSSFTYGATPWPRMPEPPRSEVHWVSDDMRVNGVPMRVQSFESKSSVVEVQAFYAAHWRHGAGGRAQMVVTQADPYVLLGKLHGPFYLMVKLKSAEGGGTQGTLSVSQVQGIQPRIDASGIPAPAHGAKAVNVVESIDAGKRSKQVLWFSGDSVPVLAARYHASLVRAGWTLVQEQSAPQAAEASVVRMYGRNKQQLDVAMGADLPNRMTVMNTNLVTFD